MTMASRSVALSLDSLISSGRERGQERCDDVMFFDCVGSVVFRFWGRPDSVLFRRFGVGTVGFRCGLWCLRFGSLRLG